MDKLYSQQQLNRDKSKKVLKAVVVLGLVFGAVTVLAGSFAKTVNANDIRTATVVRGNLQSGISASGTLIPEYEETVVSQLESHLKKVMVQAGQTVVAGQVLLVLDTAKIKLQLGNDIEAIALKNNKIQMREHELKQTLSDLRGKAELLKIDLESRQTKYDRFAKLTKFGVSSELELKEAKLDIKRTTIEIGQLMQKIDNIQASTKTQIEGLALEKSILVKSHAETVRLYDSAVVKAPSDGLVIWLKNEEGSTVRSGESLVKIADTGSYKLDVSISDFYANQLYQGMPASFDYDGFNFNGSVYSVIAGQTEGALKLMVQLDKTIPAQKLATLRQRLRVDVNLITGSVKDALMIDKGPFINGAGLQKVFVVADNQAKRVEVSVGSSNNHFYQIKSGVAAGDQIIISDVSEFANLTQFDIR
ncbi:MAG: HlyD family efflux transporter periplasmic adaptor subunit [Algicola sp.]|nr:HlyD family efflux transporter periplasmic adaptor subunit [Algicola sp.]